MIEKCVMEWGWQQTSKNCERRNLIMSMYGLHFNDPFCSVLVPPFLDVVTESLLLRWKILFPDLSTCVLNLIIFLYLLLLIAMALPAVFFSCWCQLFFSQFPLFFFQICIFQLPMQNPEITAHAAPFLKNIQKQVWATVSQDSMRDDMVVREARRRRLALLWCETDHSG